MELYLVSKKNKFFGIFSTNIRYPGGTSEYQTIHKVLCSRTKFSTAVQLNSALPYRSVVDVIALIRAYYGKSTSDVFDVGRKDHPRSAAGLDPSQRQSFSLQ